jgi:hypothetical protein
MLKTDNDLIIALKSSVKSINIAVILAVVQRNKAAKVFKIFKEGKLQRSDESGI